jgi:hypothetical protein
MGPGNLTIRASLLPVSLGDYIVGAVDFLVVVGAIAAATLLLRASGSLDWRARRACSHSPSSSPPA